MSTTMAITGGPKRFAWRRLLVLMVAVLFMYYYFPGASESPRELADASSTDSDPSTLLEFTSDTSGADALLNGSSAGALSHSDAFSTITHASAATRHSHVNDLSSETQSVTTRTTTSLLIEDSTSTQTTTTARQSSFSETGVEASSSLSITEPTSSSMSPPPSSIPENIPDDGFPVDEILHRIVYSTSTVDRKYFDVSWHSNGSYNPSVLRHPTLPDQYVIVAQLQQNKEAWMAGTYAMCCTASFIDEVLTCNEPPQPLPIEWTPDTHCPGDPEPGPHDPRIFYGPNAAFIMYGSRSTHSCHGMWVQDLQHLISGFNVSSDLDSFPSRVDIQRPPPYREIEKNYFLFWDHENNTYVHQDISPERVFTPLYPSGSVGPNLAPITTDLDTPCLDRYMPKTKKRNESESGAIAYETVHQATNSLSITLCNRADPSCQSNSSNTFIMSLFNHKTFYSQHAEYFPYILLFQQAPPFAVHAISTKSIWVHGRGRLTMQTPTPFWRRPGDVLPDHSELFFVVSIAWKSQSQRYHGYMDDELIIGMGIEDFTSAGIDVVAKDLLQDLGYCENAGGEPETIFEGEMAT